MKLIQLIPTLMLACLAGCGGGGGDGDGVIGAATPGTPASGASGASGESPTTPTDTSGGTVQLAAATALEDGTPVGTTEPGWTTPTAASGQGQAIDGLACGLPGSAYGYTHLSIFQNGQQLAVPANIGVVGPTQTAQTGCAYPLHTDDASGKIRIDASAAAPLTLGQFFAVWGQPLTASSVAGLNGQPVVAYINDGGALTQYTGDLADIPLTPQREITLVAGTAPAQIPTYAWTEPPPLAATPIVLDETSVGSTMWADGNTATGGHGEAIDGLQCGNMTEVYHVHTHLAIIKDGQMLAIPGQVGIPTGCTYEIHTHNPSGELHVESDTAKRYTLGQFFKIWGQPLTTANVAGLTGAPVKFYVADNGDLREYVGDPADIELTSHRSITVQIGAAPAAIPTYTWDTDK